ncbi:GSCFA domain-containing protein [Aliiglaciecola sp.]|nr:GSCFA domain-containing protein [Aliiglaciecola sp.]
MNIAVVGNCQVVGIAKILSTFFPESQCQPFHMNKNGLFTDGKPTVDFGEFDYVFMNKYAGEGWEYLSAELCQNIENIIFIPPIVFAGNHPDCIYVNQGGEYVDSALGPYHSFIAINAWLNDIPLAKCLNLFKPSFYSLLNWGGFYQQSILSLKARLNEYGCDGEVLVDKWVGDGCFMHTINHPKLGVLIDLIEHICRQNNLNPIFTGDASDFISDNLMSNAIFPVYLGLQGANSSNGETMFKCPNKGGNGALSGLTIMSLEAFIRDSFERYQLLDKKIVAADIAQHRLEGFRTAFSKFSEIGKHDFEHPYKPLPDHNYWSRAITKVASEKVDPVVDFKFKINPETKVATAGSCFAQHIAKTLAKSGMNYYVEETGPENLSDDKKSELGYGLFSARYGNIYTAKQLLQLFDRAFGLFTPSEEVWETKDGKYLDPYRPNIGEVFDSPAEVISDSQLHLHNVREMFTKLDVFVFTLGLTETWLNLTDGSVYPVAPGILTKNPNQGQYKFVNFDYSDVLADMHSFIQKLRLINPRCQLILTVSPVPLAATAEPRHVLTSTTLSKSVLRSVADKLSETYTFASYFPSYEIITGNFNRGSYFAKDLRSVLDIGVSHVMGLFMKHCTTQVIEEQSTEVEPEKSDVIDEEYEKLSAVICDEDLIEL